MSSDDYYADDFGNDDKAPDIVDLTDPDYSPRKITTAARGVCRKSKSCANSGRTSRSHRKKDAETFQGYSCIYPQPAGYGSVQVTAKDLSRLMPSVMLNDTVIDFYFTWLACHLSEHQKGKYYIFSSEFYKKLVEKQHCKRDPFAETGQLDVNSAKTSALNHKRVSAWTKDVDIFAYDYIFIPIHESLHWSMLIVCNPRDKCLILHLDSMTESKHKPDSIWSPICHYLQAEWASKQAEPEPITNTPKRLVAEALASGTQLSMNRFIDIDQTQTHALKGRLPTQDNFTDCGLYMLMYVEFFIAAGPSVMTKEFLNIDHKTVPTAEDYALIGVTYPNFMTPGWFEKENVAALRTYMRHLLLILFRDQAAVQSIPHVDAQDLGGACSDEDTALEVLMMLAPTQPPANAVCNEALIALDKDIAAYTRSNKQYRNPANYLKYLSSLAASNQRAVDAMPATVYPSLRPHQHATYQLPKHKATNNNCPNLLLHNDGSFGAGTSKYIPPADKAYVSKAAALRILRLQDTTAAGGNRVGEGCDLDGCSNQQPLQGSRWHDTSGLINDATLLGIVIGIDGSADAAGCPVQRDLDTQGTSSVLRQVGGQELLSIQPPVQYPTATSTYKNEQSVVTGDATKQPPLPPYLCPGSAFLQDMSVLFKPWSPANNQHQITVAAFMACTLNTEQLQLQQENASLDPNTLMIQLGRLAKQALSIREQHKFLQAMTFPETTPHAQLKFLFNNLNAAQIDKFLVQEKLVAALIQLYKASQQTVPNTQID